MIPETTIYEWANLDARTGSFPSENKIGGFEPSNGIRKIFNHSYYAPIPGIFAETRRMNQEQEDLYNQMLNQQTVFDKSKLVEQNLKDKENELERESTDLNLVKEDIIQERQRLLNRGYNPPEETKKEEPNKVSSASEKKAKINWKAFEKWGIELLVIIVLESFFGFALWDSLRDQKSIIQVALRIAASGILVITLHIAEYRYKTTKKGIYAVYIVYGILTLVALLIGALVLGYFFPQYLEGNAGFDSNVFNLNTDESLTNTAPPNSIIGFFIRYDFILGIIAVIVFMLLGFLDSGKRKTDKTEGIQSEDKVQNDVNPVFVQLLNLYEKKSAQMEKINELKTEVEKLKSEPTALSLEILDSLRNLKKKIEVLVIEISNKQNLLDQCYNQLEEQLNQYKTDYTDVFNSLPAASFVTPVWPDRNDIQQYYKTIKK